MTRKHSVVGRFGLGTSVLALAVAGVALGGGTAWAQAEAAAPPDDPAWAYAPPADAPAVPPQVEEPPIPAANGGYCFAGPHPADPRYAPGVAWDDGQGEHIHEYPPLDLRLFAFQNGCYYFIGDPADFGYRGQTYAYYGAHPVLDTYGGGWCFMIGGHSHLWQPWSPYFVVAGSWYYWQGAYDRAFWNYWPYYATYYRRQYPTYYRGGRFARGGWADRGQGGFAVAPALGHATAGTTVRPTVGQIHFGTTSPNIDARQAGARQARPGFGQQQPGWGQQPSQGWGSARPGWGTTPQPVRPMPAPGRGYSAPSGGTPWPSGHSSFGHGGGHSSFRAVPMAPSGSARSFGGFSGGGSGSFFRSSAPSSSGRGGGGGGFRHR
jgi:hypothetical protein